MPVYVPQENRPYRCGRLNSLAAVIGADPDGAPKRPLLYRNYEEPSLKWKERNEWLRKVRRLVAQCKANRESFPHKVEAVARAIAELGNVCKASLDYIGTKAGCVRNTVQACAAWLESKGALTWSNTAGRHQGRIVRKANLYTLIMNFAGAKAVIARTMRAIWRERPRIVPASKPNGCHGTQNLYIYIDPYEAIRRLREVATKMETAGALRWAEERAKRLAA